MIVVGDVNASLSATLAAKKIPLKVAHIEAGLRSGDWAMPEEINRMVVDRLADLLLTTGEGARQNLLAEGAEERRIVVAGNIMIDTLEQCREKAGMVDPADFLPHFPPGPLGLVTLHRPSNVDDRSVLEELTEVLGRLSRELPLLLPLHPRTKARLGQFALMERLAAAPGIHLTGPLGYLEMLALLLRAEILVTDSGGLQEEATVLNLPCVTLRSTTERPETLLENGGTAVLAGNRAEAIEGAFRRLRSSPPVSRRPPFWDGNTAQRILAALWERRGEAPWRTSGNQGSPTGPRPSPTR